MVEVVGYVLLSMGGLISLFRSESETGPESGSDIPTTTRATQCFSNFKLLKRGDGFEIDIPKNATDKFQWDFVCGLFTVQTSCVVSFIEIGLCNFSFR